ncbi:MAG: MerR family transcriptional regulator [Rhodospirillaceae bacterium]|nr:MAG: MerR family transcriptional regulator [Rhodospirillaceae bacterium]
MTDRDFISIGILAKRSTVSVETICFYECIGLLPAPPRSSGGYRLYRSGHAERLQSSVGRTIPARRSTRCVAS